jgi:hypothetical protein
MDIQKTLVELREYRLQLAEAISALESLARVRGSGSIRDSTGHVRSDETRKKMAESQRKRWAKYQKTKQPGAPAAKTATGKSKKSK